MKSASLATGVCTRRGQPKIVSVAQEARPERLV
jgi:hypothetical protein